jgi:hypothetical protein
MSHISATNRMVLGLLNSIIIGGLSNISGSTADDGL